jgi:2-oxoglutarate/2-oxoacid ferredoxin oxidoreductase subunit beta
VKLIDIFQPCVIFNKTNTFKWFKDNVYVLPDDHGPNDKVKALESHPFPIVVIYKSPPKMTLEDILRVESQMDETPLYSHQVNFHVLNDEMNKYS